MQHSHYVLAFVLVLLALFIVLGFAPSNPDPRPLELRYTLQCPDNILQVMAYSNSQTAEGIRVGLFYISGGLRAADDQFTNSTGQVAFPIVRSAEYRIRNTERHSRYRSAQDILADITICPRPYVPVAPSEPVNETPATPEEPADELPDESPSEESVPEAEAPTEPANDTPPSALITSNLTPPASAPEPSEQPSFPLSEILIGAFVAVLVLIGIFHILRARAG